MNSLKACLGPMSCRCPPMWLAQPEVTDVVMLMSGEKLLTSEIILLPVYRILYLSK